MLAAATRPKTTVWIARHISTDTVVVVVVVLKHASYYIWNDFLSKSEARKQLLTICCQNVLQLKVCIYFFNYHYYYSITSLPKCSVDENTHQYVQVYRLVLVYSDGM